MPKKTNYKTISPTGGTSGYPQTRDNERSTSYFHRKINTNNTIITGCEKALNFEILIVQMCRTIEKGKYERLLRFRREWNAKKKDSFLRILIKQPNHFFAIK